MILKGGWMWCMKKQIALRRLERVCRIIHPHFIRTHNRALHTNLEKIHVITVNMW